MGGCQGTAAPEQARLRRLALREAPPAEAAVEVGHARDGGPRRSAEADLVRGPTLVGAMRTVAVVEAREVGAVAVDLGSGAEEPEIAVPDERLLEGSEDSLDSAVRPCVARFDEHVPGSVLGQDLGHVGGAEIGARSVRRRSGAP
jgi:hypothetical protein